MQAPGRPLCALYIMVVSCHGWVQELQGGLLKGGWQTSYGGHSLSPCRCATQPGPTIYHNLVQFSLSLSLCATLSLFTVQSANTQPTAFQGIHGRTLGFCGPHFRATHTVSENTRVLTTHMAVTACVGTAGVSTAPP